MIASLARRSLPAAALLLGLAVAPRAAHSQDLGIAVGERAPAAVLETLDGKSVDLAQWVGKTPVLIEFWATWCPNCKALEPQLQAASKKYAGKMKFLGVAVSVNQSPERVKAYAQRHGLPLEVLYDRKGNASGAYDVPATSYIVVIDRAGKVVYTGLGADQNIEAAVRKAVQ